MAILSFMALLGVPTDSAWAAEFMVNDMTDGGCTRVIDDFTGGSHINNGQYSGCNVNSVAAMNVAGLDANSMVLNGNGAFINGKLSIGGAFDVGGNQINHLAAGTALTDAVNVGQAQSIVGGYGGGAAINADGTITSPTYSMQGGTQNNVGDALGVLDIGVNRRVAYDTNADGTTNYSSVTLGNGQSSGMVALHNVAPGNVSVASGDAVNGSQLYATNQDVTANAQNIAKLDSRVTVNEGSINDLMIGHAGLVQQADTNAQITVAAASGGTVVDITGTAGARQITGVAAGTKDNDAVNLSQLNDVAGDVNDLDALAVKYDDASKTSITLGGAGAVSPVALHNIADGELSGASHDAVNGSQLYATHQQVESNTDNINNLLIGHAGLVQQVDASATVTMAASSGGTLVTVNGIDGDRQIRGVAAGTQDNDAVNVGQLMDLAGQVGDIDSSAVKYDDASRTSITLGGIDMSAPVAIHNVANGISTYDAVNFGQLADLQSDLQLKIGGLDSRVTVLENEDRTPPYLDGTGGSGANDKANAGDTPGVALGYNSVATGDNASAVGHNAQALGAYGLAAGNDSYAAGDHDTAIGGNAKVNADNSVAVGANSTVAAGASNAAAIGANSSANAVSGTAIGQGATVVSSGTNAVALGAGSVAERANTVSVGAEGAERQITNVAAGTQATDAVNVGQLQNLQGWTGQKIDDLKQLINHNQRQANRGIASSAALVNNMPYAPGKVALSAGAASYRGESALGVAVSRWSMNGRVNINAGVSVARGDSPIFRVGAGVVLGD
ncbi:hypothetical protein GCM10010981_40710 [Dyella nitratireducens]|uniref:Uncharacterized protein n=2 Tax=Dyella nitratireducens TaxID=1849580 RepID=A0ABQ1GP93_9GAMM|nr:hypothetical protein GCM10010981_40710 [Dyella nitratireducens]GLQ42451.1 hypothetical protein GCM10007902_23010 [Dyella nitratireducens]